MAENKRKFVWKVLDILVCIAFGLFNSMMPLTSYCGIYLVLLPFCLFVFLWCLGGHPYRPQLSELKRRLYTILRCILYSGALVFSFLPYTMHYDAAWYYPVQRAMVLSCYTYEYRQFLDDFMPHYIPSGAENYQFRYVPKMLQGSSMLEVSFFTDIEIIAEYRETAVEYGAKQLSLTLPEGMTEEDFDLDGDPTIRSDDENMIWKWRYFLREDYGQNPDGMELYLFESSLYVLSEETGYFLLYD